MPSVHVAILSLDEFVSAGDIGDISAIVRVFLGPEPEERHEKEVQRIGRTGCIV